MDISTIADQVYQYLKSVNSDTVNQVVSENMMIALIVTTVIGIFLSMFGLKLIRLWSALLGLVAGAGIGFAVTELAGLEPMIVVGATIGGGIVLAFLAGFFYRFGIFLLALLTGTYIAILFVNPQDWIFLGVCLAIGLVIALLALKFVEPIMIVVTSILGGVLAGDAIATLAEFDNPIFRYGIMVLVAIVGGIIQFTLESGKRKKKNLKKAAEIREQNSTENEVEKARAMFDDAILLDDEPDDKSDDKPDDKPKKEPDLSYLDEIDLDDEEYEDEEESDYVDGYNPDDYTDLDDLEDDDDFIIITDDDK
ncbi:TMEM198/TM7SF3 family protein [Mediterraneibacter sp. NSJ-151]|uniref:TMEM198/TM7SF3 family protein n=1 Tax=Mediterraneibacter sp. NSJ-151 TaxID=2897708 RepID=UPI001F0A3A57|nr:TMEM198/TM7SF3 family protein [Mediterraneibacter sp. NSJ-151]MCH4280177.1 TMEM198/TM7SF3 family protein [Mediterraneibacter sp. NSJ-151]